MAQWLNHAADELQYDADELLKALFGVGVLKLQYATEEMKKDATIVQAAVEHDGEALQYATEEMKGHRCIVQAAVEQNGRALQYATEEIKNDATIVQAAVEQGGEVLQ